MAHPIVRWLAASLPLLTAATLVRADDTNETPTSQPAIVDASPRRFRFMSIDELTADLGLDIDFNRRHVRTEKTSWLGPPAYRQRNESRIFQETLGLNSNGSLIDERVLKYDAMARFGLSQERYQEDTPGLGGDETNPHGQILEYDLRLQALPVGKISANAFASKLEDRLTRPFLPSMDRVRERYGGQVLYNDAKLPMSLTFEHLYDDLDGSRSFFYDDSQQRAEDSLRYEATWQATTNHSMKFNYEYMDRDEQYSGTRDHFSNRHNYLSLLDTIQFGDQGRNRLETLARYEDEKGDWARDVSEFAPRLHLQHTDDLFTTYGVQWLKENFQDLESKTARADVGVTHTLANALTSSLNLYGLTQDVDENGDSKEWGSLTNFAFSKDNDLGRFSANLAHNHTNYSSDDGDREGIVTGESVTFTDPLPALLSHNDVLPWTVVVTDTARSRVFLFGRDYTIIPIGRTVSLQRVFTGQILNRQTVLVSYVYRVYNNFAVRRDRVDLRIQEDFKGGWTPYYAGSVQEEDVSRSSFQLYNTDRDVNRHRIGMTYKQKRWSTGVEYEYNDDNIDPYQAVHVNADAVLMEDAKQQINARGTVSQFDFDGQHDLDPRDTVLLDLGMNYRYLLGRNIEANANAAYRYEDDSLFGRTNGVDIRGNLAWRIGLFTVSLELEYETLHLPNSEDDSFGVWIRVRREIPIIGSARS